MLGISLFKAYMSDETRSMNNMIAYSVLGAIDRTDEFLQSCLGANKVLGLD